MLFSKSSTGYALKAFKTTEALLELNEWNSRPSMIIAIKIDSCWDLSLRAFTAISLLRNASTQRKLHETTLRTLEDIPYGKVKLKKYQLLYTCSGLLSLLKNVNHRGSYAYVQTLTVTLMCCIVSFPLWKSFNCKDGKFVSAQHMAI